MKMKKYKRETKGYYTKALRFLDEKTGAVKFIVSYSIATNGKRWLDDNKKERLVGKFKQEEEAYTARALVLGNLKLSLVTVNG